MCDFETASHACQPLSASCRQLVLDFRGRGTFLQIVRGAGLLDFRMSNAGGLVGDEWKAPQPPAITGCRHDVRSRRPNNQSIGPNSAMNRCLHTLMDRTIHARTNSKVSSAHGRDPRFPPRRVLASHFGRGLSAMDRRRLSQQLVLFASLGNASKPKIGRLPDLIINGRQIRELLWVLQSIDWPLIHARTAGGWRLATFGLKFGRRASKFILEGQ